MSITCAFFWIGFASIELFQIIRNFEEYWYDYWNYIDNFALILVGISLQSAIYACIYESLMMEIRTSRTIGSIACFFLWIKVFYWMRLFKETAYYITLISQTILDIKIFSYLVCIVIFAFANFFLIINQNTPSNQNHNLISSGDHYETSSGNFSYVKEYVGYNAIDSWISIYLLAMGEFNFLNYKLGPDKYVAFIFFLMATFIIIIVFMNMLIAIMG